MAGIERCNEILRLIDEVLADEHREVDRRPPRGQVRRRNDRRAGGRRLDVGPSLPPGPGGFPPSTWARRQAAPGTGDTH